MFLQLNDIEKFYDSENGVTDINISVNKGELVTLLGPSGCGKTTILNILGGFLKTDKGSVELENQDITYLPPENRPVTTVFQSYALFPHMNVMQNVTYGLKIKKLDKKTIKEKGEEILDLVGLLKYKDRGIGQLSGGQQQRVALARALVMNPKLLLLDEPLSNLDAKLRIKMRKELKDIQKKFNITMLFVTHDQEEALTISDKIVVMNQGKIQQIGTPEDVYINPKNEFVADFIGRVNLIEKDGVKKFIRPENLSFTNEQTELTGEIVQKHFLGAYRTYFVDVNNNIIQVDVPIKTDENLNIGDIVSII